MGRVRRAKQLRRGPTDSAPGARAGRRKAYAGKTSDARRRRQRMWWVSGAVVAAAAFAVAISVGIPGPGGGPPRPKLASLASLGHLVPPSSPGSLGPEGVPIPQAPPLVGTGNDARGRTVDGIQCNTSEQPLFHVHTHLTIFVDGAARQIPDGIGIVPPRQVQQTSQGPFVKGGTCFYWLHTHAPDGIIHIESPVQQTYTLGDFFDIWGQPLGPTQVGPATGRVTAFYDGKVYVGNPRNIPIGNHVQIQLDIGSPLIAPESIRFPSGL